MGFSSSVIRWLAAVAVVGLVSACGGGSAGTGPVTTAPVVLGSNNVLGISVGAGTEALGYNVNRLFTDVTICVAGSTAQCQTIKQVLVDTGSSGLRLLSSAIDPAMKLDVQTTSRGLPLLNCAQFVDNSFAWGPVFAADIVLGGKAARNVPFQIMGVPAYQSLAASCSTGSEMNSVAALGANGIIGLGLFKDDCGSACVTTTGNGFYYTCADVLCMASVPSRASIAQQLKNPVALFKSDNNGILIDLPAVGSGGQVSLTGSLYFGIATQPNNQLTAGAVLTTRNLGHITTLLSGQSLNTSFIDTGSNGLYFDSGALALCGGSARGFYCPDSTVTLLATTMGANDAKVPITFSVDNAEALFGGYPNAVFPGLSGPIGDDRTFDWGLPFFYGRRVLIGIEGQPSALGIGPFYAF